MDKEAIVVNELVIDDSIEVDNVAVDTIEAIVINR